MGAVPTDSTHQWLPYSLPLWQMRESFTRPWERQRIPFVLTFVDGEGREHPEISVPTTAEPSTQVMLYAHQHVKQTPIAGRWCCLTEPLVDPNAPVEGSCAYCAQPPRARGLCLMHYTRLRRHGDPMVARAYTAGAGR